jgi:glycogen operon protein
MLQGGDEIGRTQQGNNNAYCQDNEISWYDWNLDDRARRMLAFTRAAIDARRRHPALRRRRFFKGRRIRGADIRDIIWLGVHGDELRDEEWDGDTRTIGVHLAGEALDETDAEGQLITDDTLLLLFNAHPHTVPFRVPRIDGKPWRIELDTADVALAVSPDRADPHGLDPATGTFLLAPRSFVLLAREAG